MQLMPRSNAASCASYGIGKILAAALFAASLAVPVPALAFDVPELPELLQEKVQQAQKACSNFENGQFGAVRGNLVESGRAAI